MSSKGGAIQALKKGETPPQNSALGGQIGIHGLGSASVSVHQQINWTAGCIALTNSQVDRLSRWVFKGMVVVVM